MDDKQFKEFMKTMAKFLKELESIKYELYSISSAIGTASANMIESRYD